MNATTKHRIPDRFAHHRMHAPAVVAALTQAGLEVPFEPAYTAEQSAVIQGYYARVDPNGARAADRKREAAEEVC